MADLDDHELVARAQEGEVEAVGILYERHSEWVYRYALKRVSDPEIAKELVQETFLRVLESLPRFRSGHSFGAWLNGIAVHVVADCLRSRYQWRDKLPDLVEKLMDYDLAPDYEHIDAAITAKLIADRILSQLNPNYRSIIRMRIMQGMSRGETALELYGEDTDENRRKVSVTLYDAMKAARKAGEQIRKLVLAQGDPLF
jgi:RNA polymerase sigma-70 factor (ECF subfamily)